MAFNIKYHRILPFSRLLILHNSLFAWVFFPFLQPTFGDNLKERTFTEVLSPVFARLKAYCFEFVLRGCGASSSPVREEFPASGRIGTNQLQEEFD